MVITYSALPRKIMLAHARTSSNYKWLRDNRNNIRRRYGDVFVAIANKKVVYHTKSHLDLLKYLSEHHDREDLIAGRTRSKDNILLL